MDKAIDNYFTKIINENHAKVIQEEIINSKNKKLNKVQNVFAILIGIVFCILPIVLFIGYITYAEKATSIVCLSILVVSYVVIQVLEHKKRK